jgi:hypothetical protein
MSTVVLFQHNYTRHYPLSEIWLNCLFQVICCNYEVLGIILLQTHLYTYSLLSGVIFEVPPLSSYAAMQKKYL